MSGEKRAQFWTSDGKLDSLTQTRGERVGWPGPKSARDEQEERFEHTEGERETHLDALEHVLVAEQDRMWRLLARDVLQEVLLHQPQPVDALPDRLEWSGNTQKQSF